MAKAIAAVTRQKLDMNQQCLSEGVANLAGSFFQCMPGSGSLTRSAINQQAGARTQWSGVISAAAVALIVVVARALRTLHPALGAGRHPDADGRADGESGATCATTCAPRASTPSSSPRRPSPRFAISIEFCVLIGVFMSFLLAVPRAGQHAAHRVRRCGRRSVHERLAEDEPPTQVLIFGLEGEMFFGSTVSLEEHLETIEAPRRRATRASSSCA